MLTSISVYVSLSVSVNICKFVLSICLAIPKDKFICRVLTPHLHWHAKTQEYLFELTIVIITQT